jgi:hypothetical protein
MHDGEAGRHHLQRVIQALGLLHAGRREPADVFAVRVAGPPAAAAVKFTPAG